MNAETAIPIITAIVATVGATMALLKHAHLDWIAERARRAWDRRRGEVIGLGLSAVACSIWAISVPLANVEPNPGVPGPSEPSIGSYGQPGRDGIPGPLGDRGPVGPPGSPGEVDRSEFDLDRALRELRDANERMREYDRCCVDDVRPRLGGDR